MTASRLARASRELDSWRGALVGGASAVALLVVAPLPPPTLAGATAAVPAGVALGLALFATLGGARGVRSALRRTTGRIRPAMAGVPLVVRATSEEVLFRWCVLGLVAAHAGAITALAVSAVGFGLFHGPAQGLRGIAVQISTGTSLGGIVLVTGTLAAAVAAHVAYNLLVAAAAGVEDDVRERRENRPRSGAPARVARHPATADEAPIAVLEGAEKRFGSVRALAGLDLHLKRHELLAVLGSNGAGKTTALALLLGLRQPDRGRVEMLGRNPRALATRRRVGWVPQELAFPPTLRLIEVVELVRAHYPQPVPAAELVVRFGLAGLAQRQVGGLSGGQQRRLALALAFAGRPDALVLDEPTVGLDVESRLAVWGELRRYVAGGGSVLLATHNLEEAEALATRIAIVHRGRVMAEGTAAAIKYRARVESARARPPTGNESRLVGAAGVRDPHGSGGTTPANDRVPLTLEEAFLVLTCAAPG